MVLLTRRPKPCFMPLVKCSSMATKGRRMEANYLSLGRPLRPAMYPAPRLYKPQLRDSKVFRRGRNKQWMKCNADHRKIAKMCPRKGYTVNSKKATPQNFGLRSPPFSVALLTSSQTLFHATGEVLLAGYQGRAKGSKLSLSGPTPTACHVPRSPPL